MESAPDRHSRRVFSPERAILPPWVFPTPLSAKAEPPMVEAVGELVAEGAKKRAEGGDLVVDGCAHGGAGQRSDLPNPMAYSYLSATMGSTFVARRAGR